VSGGRTCDVAVQHLLPHLPFVSCLAYFEHTFITFIMRGLFSAGAVAAFAMWHAAADILYAGVNSGM
jgi:hypothetical protein